MERHRRIGIVHAYPSTFLADSLHEAGYRIVFIGNADALKGHPGVEACLETPLWDSTEVRRSVLAYHAKKPFDALLPVNEGTVVQTAELAEELGLKALSVPAAVSSRNKYLSYLLWEAQGVPVPATIPVHDADAAWAHIEQHWNGKAVIKLVDSMNSQGVIAVSSRSECREGVRQLYAMIQQSKQTDLKIDRNRFAYGRSSLTLMAQSFCEGLEVSADVFLMPQGEDRVLALLEKVPSTGPYFAETASIYPSALSAAEAQEVERLAIQAARALGLEFGPAHVEIRFQQGVAKVLEAGLRPGGGYTVPLIQRLQGVNVFESQAHLALGQELEWPTVNQDAAVLFGGIPYPVSGTLRGVEGLQVFDNCPQMEQLVILNDVGDPVRAMPESAQPHYCYYLLAGKHRDELLSLHRRISETVTLNIEEDLSHAS
jgi:D-alanine-D-alanine ligase-like ATP-grasp enzyme